MTSGNSTFAIYETNSLTSSESEMYRRRISSTVSLHPSEQCNESVPVVISKCSSSTFLIQWMSNYWFRKWLKLNFLKSPRFVAFCFSVLKTCGSCRNLHDLCKNCKRFLVELRGGIFSRKRKKCALKIKKCLCCREDPLKSTCNSCKDRAKFC